MVGPAPSRNNTNELPIGKRDYDGDSFRDYVRTSPLAIFGDRLYLDSWIHAFCL
jgi:hypothetical protein